jgi:hypothetical protein
VEESDARIAHCLASLFNPLLYPGMTLDLAISQTEIGLLTGASRQRTSQALHTLQDRGLLRIGYGSITIVDLDGLRNYGT